MKLVDDWKTWWKWLSTWLVAMNLTFIAAYENITPLKEYIPDKYFHIIVGTLLILTAVGRVIKQNAQPPSQ